MSARHYAGNTGVPGGEPAVEWRVNFFDSQSDTNPVETGHRIVPIADVTVPASTGLTPETWDSEHELIVAATGDVIETRINGVPVDRRELSGDQRRAHGSVGFAAHSSAQIRRLTVDVDVASDRRVDVEFTSGQSGVEARPSPGLGRRSDCGAVKLLVVGPPRQWSGSDLH